MLTVLNLRLKQTKLSRRHGSRCILFFNPFSDNSKVQKSHLKKVFNTSAATMYKIVSEVDKYPEFVPFVVSASIEEKDTKTNVPTKAGLQIGWKSFDESFSCKLRCIEPKQVEATALTLTLFEELHTKWAFQEIKVFGKDKCEVTFDLQFRFKNPTYNTVSSLFSNQITQIMVKAFEERAKAMRHEGIS